MEVLGWTPDPSSHSGLARLWTFLHVEPCWRDQLSSGGFDVLGFLSLTPFLLSLCFLSGRQCDPGAGKLVTKTNHYTQQVGMVVCPSDLEGRNVAGVECVPANVWGGAAVLLVGGTKWMLSLGRQKVLWEWAYTKETPLTFPLAGRLMRQWNQDIWVSLWNLRVGEEKTRILIPAKGKLVSRRDPKQLWHFVRLFCKRGLGPRPSVLGWGRQRFD